MKEKNRLLVLKILSAGAVYCLFYALFLILRAYIFNTSGGFLSFLYMLFIAVAGFALSMSEVFGIKLADKISTGRAATVLMLYKNNAEKKHFLLSILLYLSSIIPVSVTLTLYGQSNIIRTGFEVLSVLIIYLFAVRCGLNNAYANISRNMAVSAFVIFTAACAASMYIPKCTYLKAYISIMAYFFLLVYLIIKNQQDIDVNIYLGKFVEKSVLPRDMRKFNLKTVLLLYTAIIVLINTKSLARVMQQIWYWFMILLIKILSLFKSNGKIIEPDKLIQKAKGDEFPFKHEIIPENPFMTYFREVIVTFILLYLAYRAFILLYRGVFKRLLPFIADFLKKFFQNRSIEISITPIDYDDETVIEKPENEAGKRRKAGTAVRKARKQLKSITEPVERIRFMYAAAIELLQAAGIKISGSDTVGNINAKAAAETGLADIRQPLGKLSGRYEKVRYGCRIPAESELSEAEENYREITELLLKKR